MKKDLQKEIFEYLVEVRDSGVVNMWGAAPYVQRKFNISIDEAGDYLVAWIKSFDK